jgi:predicted transcriptional regulator
MKTISLKVDKNLETRLTAAARHSGTSRSEVVRTALEAFLDQQEAIRPGSCYELAADLAGSVKGPGDLSTNKKYMEGFGK